MSCFLRIHPPHHTNCIEFGPIWKLSWQWTVWKGKLGETWCTSQGNTKVYQHRPPNREASTLQLDQCRNQWSYGGYRVWRKAPEKILVLKTVDAQGKHATTGLARKPHDAAGFHDAFSLAQRFNRVLGQPLRQSLRAQRLSRWTPAHAPFDYRRWHPSIITSTRSACDHNVSISISTSTSI